MARLALFGGSFNPPHVGHQMAMLYALATARVERLLMVPCFRHAFDKPLEPFEHRLAMSRLAARPFGGPSGGMVEVSDIEARLGRESRTLKTVQALHAERPGTKLVLVIGADLVAERERWYGWEELRTLVEFAVVGRGQRGASEGAAVAIPDVSSSEIRERLAAGQSIEGRVQAEILDYIAAHGLYRTGG